MYIKNTLAKAGAFLCAFVYVVSVFQTAAVILIFSRLCFLFVP